MFGSKWVQAGIAGLISFIVFSMTMAPTVSFWDCGEFIASAWSLGIPHPPGTPFFVIISRVAMLAFSFLGEKAARVNLISVITSAAAVYVCYLIVFDALGHYFKLLKAKTEKGYSDKFAKFLQILGAFLGAGLVAFSDTFWFNAVEAEVYGLSMFMVFLITYLSLTWINHRDSFFGDKLLVIICYIAFLGVGVHLYSMITLPILFVFVAAMDSRMRNIESAPLWATSVMLYSIVFMVDKFIVLALCCLVISFLIMLATDKPILKRSSTLSFWFVIVALIGYSTHAYIPIRSSLNPVIDENNPEIPMDKILSPTEWGAFNDFLARKQYGSESMLSRSTHRRGQLTNQFLTYPHLGYGGYLIAQLTPFKVGEARVSPQGKVQVSAQDNQPLEKFGMSIPTQMASIGDNTFMQFALFALFHLFIFYGVYQLYKHDKRYGVYIALLYAVTSFGLVWYMNFADGTGAERYDYMNWLKDGQKGELNRVHMEVRERDYFFTPAFILAAMMMAMSFSIFMKNLWLQKAYLRPQLKLISYGVLFLGVAFPVYSNYREHDRSGLYVPWDYAYNLINSCEPNSIIFTNGDNDTFPLWFIQEVEGIRKDVRVVNLSLGNTPWYVSQIIENEPKKRLKFLGKKPLDVFPLYPQRAMSNPQVKSWISTEQFYGHINQQKSEYTALLSSLQSELELKIKGDQPEASTQESDSAKSKIQKMSVDELKLNIEKLIPKFQIYDAVSNWIQQNKKSVVQVQDQLVWDLVNSNPETPIHFATTVQRSTYMGLEKYMKMDGMVYTLDRKSLEPHSLNINFNKTKSLVDSVYKYRGLGDPDVFINDETIRLMSNYINIYAKLAYSAIEQSQKLGPETEAGKQMAEQGFNYIKFAAQQFPEEYQVYRMGASIFAQTGRFDEAKSFLEEGLAKVPDYAKSTLQSQLNKYSQLK